MQKIKHKVGGFTLLELLVVISIIGILMALGVVAFSTAQQKGRDAKRRGDIEAIQDAQEQYYAATGSYAGSFEDLTPDYLQVEPQDPQDDSYDLNVNTPDNTEYCVCADLEEDNGNADSTGNSSCSFVDTAGSGSYFCAGNLQ